MTVLRSLAAALALCCGGVAGLGPGAGRAADIACPPASLADPVPGAESFDLVSVDVSTAAYPGQWQEGRMAKGKWTYRVFANGTGLVAEDPKLRGWHVSFTCDLAGRACSIANDAAPKQAVEAAKAIGNCLIAAKAEAKGEGMPKAADGKGKPGAADKPDAAKESGKGAEKPAPAAKDKPGAGKPEAAGQPQPDKPDAAGKAAADAGKGGKAGTADAPQGQDRPVVSRPGTDTAKAPGTVPARPAGAGRNGEGRGAEGASAPEARGQSPMRAAVPAQGVPPAGPAKASSAPKGAAKPGAGPAPSAPSPAAAGAGPVGPGPSGPIAPPKPATMPPRAAAQSPSAPAQRPEPVPAVRGDAAVDPVKRSVAVRDSGAAGLPLALAAGAGVRAADRPVRGAAGKGNLPGRPTIGVQVKRPMPVARISGVAGVRDGAVVPKVVPRRPEVARGRPVGVGAAVLPLDGLAAPAGGAGSAAQGAAPPLVVALVLQAPVAAPVPTPDTCWVDHLPDELAPARMQRLLLLAGQDAGPLDGEPGARTKAALVRALGPLRDTTASPQTLARLRALLCAGGG